MPETTGLPRVATCYVFRLLQQQQPLRRLGAERRRAKPQHPQMAGCLRADRFCTFFPRRKEIPLTRHRSDGGGEVCFPQTLFCNTGAARLHIATIPEMTAGADKARASAQAADKGKTTKTAG